jgi:two-component system, LytTR family, response regulator
MLLNNKMKVFSLNKVVEDQGSHQGNCYSTDKTVVKNSGYLITMVKLKALIVDDEMHGRNNLHSLLKNVCPEIEVIGKTGKLAEAKTIIYDLNPDVLFLDINMPEMNAFQFLDTLAEKNFMLVFVTAHGEYGIQAVKADAVDYLLKPIDSGELQQTVKKLINLHAERKGIKHGNGNSKITKILVSHNEGTALLELSDIIRFEGDNNYTTIHINGKKPLIVAKTLKDFEKAIPEDSFFRIHKSDIVNLGYVMEYSSHDGGFLKLKTGERIEISRRRFQDFTDSIKRFTEKNSKP